MTKYPKKNICDDEDNEIWCADDEDERSYPQDYEPVDKYCYGCHSDHCRCHDRCIDCHLPLEDCDCHIAYGEDD